ncbi:prolipoprotein diacylglyceryl transferase [candidate division KSB1 bacterium]
MHPVLFEIGWFSLYTYGFLLMISFLTGLYLSVYRAKKLGIDPNVIIDLAIVIMVSSLVGSRGLYVAFHFEEFRGNLLDIVNPFQSDGYIGIAGLTVLGGILLSFLSSYIFLKRKRQPILRIFNIVAPAIALGTGITRIGCFFHGCCFGTACDNVFGTIFPPNSIAGAMFPQQPIHPAQLYAAFGGFAIFTILLLMERYTFFKDKAFFLYLILYGISRFTVDIFRYYEESMVISQIGELNVSLNQGISILMLVFGIVSIVYLWYTEKIVPFKK